MTTGDEGVYFAVWDVMFIHLTAPFTQATLTLAYHKIKESVYMVDVKIIEGDNIRRLETELETYLSKGYEIESMGSAVLMLGEGVDSKGRPRPPQPVIIWQYVLVNGKNNKKRSGE